MWRGLRFGRNNAKYSALALQAAEEIPSRQTYCGYAAGAACCSSTVSAFCLHHLRDEAGKSRGKRFLFARTNRNE